MRPDEPAPPAPPGPRSPSEPCVSLAELTARERERFERDHPRSRELHEEARVSLLAGVPMPWMAMWAGGFPLYLDRAHGATRRRRGRQRVRRLLPRGHGRDGGPLARADDERACAHRGHHHDAPDRGRRLGRHRACAALRRALLAVRAHGHRREPLDDPDVPPRDRPPADRGVQLVLPRLGGRVVRTLDEQGLARAREGLVGPAVDPTETTRVAEFNDIELGRGARSSTATWPASSWSRRSRTSGSCSRSRASWTQCARLCTEHGTLLIIDETHTLSAGPGGCTAAWGLEPDAVTLGKSIGGGVPIGAYGVTRRAGRADRGAGGRRLRGHRRRRRHARRQRALARGRARHARRGADRRRVRAHDRAARALRGGRRGGARRARRAVDDRLARRALRVPLLRRSRRAPAPSPPPRTTRSSRSTFTSTS